MSDQIKAIIQKLVAQLLADSMSAKNIREVIRTHDKKIHFIPIRYRVMGGVLQGLNIKFGNFIEQLLKNIIEIDSGVKNMEDSGKKLTLFLTRQTESLIDDYISQRQSPASPEVFESLLQQILDIESAASANQREGKVRDVDGLFQIDNGFLVYTERKYNDDHDTGKFVDINRKFIKTWAGLAVRYQIQSTSQLLPILYYFLPKIRYGPFYVPSKNIMRGPQLFDSFLHTTCADVIGYLSAIGDDPEILAMFDKMYKLVRNPDSDQSDFFSKM